MSNIFTKDISVIFESFKGTSYGGDLTVLEIANEHLDSFEYHLFMENVIIYHSLKDFIDYYRELFNEFEKYLDKQMDLWTLVDKKLGTVNLGKVESFLQIEKTYSGYYVDLSAPSFDSLGDLYLWIKVVIDNLETLVNETEIKELKMRIC